MPVPCQRLENYLLQSSLLALAHGGRAFILLPRNFCFSGGEEERVREWLVNNHRLDAVIHLPPDFGWADARVKTTLLCVTKERPRTETLFLDEGFMRSLLAEKTADDPVCIHSRLSVELSIRKQMGLEHPEATDERVIAFFATDHEPPELGRIEFLASGMPESIENPSFDGILLRSGLLPRTALAENRYELNFERYQLAQTSLLARALAAVENACANVKVVRLADVAQLFPGMHYDRKMAVNRKDLPKPEPKNLVGVLRIADLSRKKSPSSA